MRPSTSLKLCSGLTRGPDLPKTAVRAARGRNDYGELVPEQGSSEPRRGPRAKSRGRRSESRTASRGLNPGVLALDSRIKSTPGPLSSSLTKLRSVRTNQTTRKQMTQKRIFFTGGSGKAGKHVIPYLLNKGHKVMNVDLVPLDHPGVENLIADITDSGQMFNAMSSYSMVRCKFKPCVARDS